jgi:hypothetical protein
MFPIIVHEATVRVFNYYSKGQIYQALCCFKKFYGLVETFGVSDRNKACAVAWNLVRRNPTVLIQ